MVVYGVDNRHEYASTATGGPTNQQRLVMQSVGCLVNVVDLTKMGDRFYAANPRFNMKSLIMRLNQDSKPKDLHPDVKFGNQSCLAFATAFLVTPNRIVTSGHAAWKMPPLAPDSIDWRNVEDIKSFVFVLDWLMDDANGEWKETELIPAENVYRIDRITRLTPTDPNVQLPGNPDFLIMTLDRPVPNRAPLRFAASQPRSGDAIWIPGYPYGTPLKFAPGHIGLYPDDPAAIQTFDCLHTVCTYGGNSGSPVLNANNEVVGIHRAGYYLDFFVDANQLIRPVALQTVPTNADEYARATRTDSLRWFFSGNSKVQLGVYFSPSLGSKFCDIQVWHSTQGLGPGDQLGIMRTVDTAEGLRWFDCGTYFDANMLPIAMLHFSFRVLRKPDQKAPESRNYSRVRIVVSNPNNGKERVEMWVNTPRKVTDSDFANCFPFRILGDPIWDNGVWPGRAGNP